MDVSKLPEDGAFVSSLVHGDNNHSSLDRVETVLGRCILEELEGVILGNPQENVSLKHVWPCTVYMMEYSLQHRLCELFLTYCCMHAGHHKGCSGSDGRRSFQDGSDQKSKLLNKISVQQPAVVSAANLTSRCGACSLRLPSRCQVHFVKRRMLQQWLCTEAGSTFGCAVAQH